MKRNNLLAVPLFLLSLPVFAAKPIDLRAQHQNYLNKLTLPATLSAANNNEVTGITELKRIVDANQTTHVRFQQTYAGYPVWNGEGVAHLPPESGRRVSRLTAALPDKTTMNGIVYEGLAADLAHTNAIVFEPAQAQKAINVGVSAFAVKGNVLSKQARLVVYVDDSNKAHWVFHVSLQIENGARYYEPNFLLDAENFTIYKQWDNVKTLTEVHGGGTGGNPNLGRLSYDGLQNDLPALNIERDAAEGMCYLENDMLTVRDARTQQIFAFPCYQPDRKHNKVFWNSRINDEVNGGYSPCDDAFYAGTLLQDMYKKLYGVEVLTYSNGKPMPLKIYTHWSEENAEWRELFNVMMVGDGQDRFYPLASIGVIAHEVSHGFTSQHSNLVYEGQSGGINESFSDMAAQVVDNYAYGSNNWQIGYEITKQRGVSLRYMDQPSKDCQNNPGKECSIDAASDFVQDMNVHHSSGVFNRAFYLLATAPGWDVVKAFKVMIQANRFYWTSTATFTSAACGVMDAARDFNYDTKAVKMAFTKVGVEMRACG